MFAATGLEDLQGDAPLELVVPRLIDDGPLSLTDLFDSKSQLVIYRFMFGPDWEAGCKSCSFWADHFGATLPHLAARDVSLVCVSRAPLAPRCSGHCPWLAARGS